MSSTVSKKNSRGFIDQVRPAYEYESESGIEVCKLLMAESLRNVSEDIRQQLQFLNNKQMLQCDVRGDIRKMRIALEKIAKNTARRRRVKKATA
jgi:hypothetical protein